jgi:hypothetical protein
VGASSVGWWISTSWLWYRFDSLSSGVRVLGSWLGRDNLLGGAGSVRRLVGDSCPTMESLKVNLFLCFQLFVVLSYLIVIFWLLYYMDTVRT